MEEFSSQRALSFTESVIRDMTRVCLEAGGINLAQGFPDFDPPKVFKEAAKRAIDKGHIQYAITWGAPEFRKAIANYEPEPMFPEAQAAPTFGAVHE